MDLLTVNGLTKHYPGFALNDVSLTLPPGYIMGFIGRNGAGKTTTLKAILGLVRADAGEVTVFGQDFRTNEATLKQDIGSMLGPAQYYPTTRLARLTDVYRRFYTGWDEAAYRGYVTQFGLDETKKVGELSTGMQVKYALALALSHHARLLLLDEPTSGLDPVSRDDILDVFRGVIEAGDTSVLFSTQITSDLEACADYVTYIRAGRLVASAPTDDLLASYRLISGPKSALTDDLRAAMTGHKVTDFGFTGLVPTADADLTTGCTVTAPTLAQIMVYHERNDGPDDLEVTR